MMFDVEETISCHKTLLCLITIEQTDTDYNGAFYIIQTDSDTKLKQKHTNGYISLTIQIIMMNRFNSMWILVIKHSIILRIERNYYYYPIIMYNNWD